MTFIPAIIRRIYETNSNFRVKLSKTEKVEILFFRRFLLLLTKFPFWMNN